MIDCILNNDCMVTLPTLVTDSVQLVLTDIPYGEVNRPSNGLRNLMKGDADIKTFELSPFLAECLRVCSGSFYIFCGTEQVSEIRHTLCFAGLTTRLGIWEKSNPSPMNGQHNWLSGIECCVYGKKRGATFNEHCKNSVWKYPCVHRKRHPTEKPLALCEYLIAASSNPGDVVLDPCLGSGTVAVAAQKLGRHYIGIELNPDYCRIAEERIYAVTKET